MRTIDMLHLANDAPMVDADLSALMAAIGRSLCAAMVVLLLAVAATGITGNPSLTRWLLIGGAPALSAALVWPMCVRRGLDRVMVGSERAGLWALVASNALALGTMMTLGAVITGTQHPAYALQILLIPAMLTWMRRDAIAKGLLLDEDR